MCGKFTAMFSWRQVWEFSQPLTTMPKDSGPDEEVTYRTGGPLPVIVFDKTTGERRVVPMRWGYDDPRAPGRLKHMHVRSETIEEKPMFRDSFLGGQRGIVVFKTFNEGEEVPTKSGKSRTIQWTIDPQDGHPRGFAFLWKEFGTPDKPDTRCVMVTVPANELIRRDIQYNQDDPRMPAILRDESDSQDWCLWLGQDRAPLDDIKAVLQTLEGVSWKTAPEPKRKPEKPKPPRRQTPSQEPDLF